MAFRLTANASASRVPEPGTWTGASASDTAARIRCAALAALLAASVISIPITAKSPDWISNKSGQPLRAAVRAPFACGSGPSRRTKLISLVIQSRALSECVQAARRKYSVYTVVVLAGPEFRSGNVNIPKHRTALGENIRTFRQERQLSLEKLAERANL